ncbi:hypothetical protein KI387_004984 [Taxus chinensis]|uniref:ABC transmembrane type-1 domain-containing protein n=1 Tax=Taxus chinensis TaxID=29808 RepID=A0AA38GLA7_TAXCH|nr:hypothetical protein KI387_004984 [Taxus chinensis]
MTIRLDAKCLYVLMDFEGMGSFERTEQEDMLLSVLNAAISNLTNFNKKLGNFIHYMATFVAGFVVGFTTVWQLAFLTVAVVPLIAVVGAVHTIIFTKLSSKSHDAYAEAGNIAEQALAQIRTVFSFVGEEKTMQAYSAALKVAQKIGYRSGVVKGIGMGLTYCIIFCCYALLLWYGGLLMRHHDTKGGSTIATTFSVVIGGLALGQSAPSLTAFAKAKSATVNIFQTIEHRPKIDKLFYWSYTIHSHWSSGATKREFFVPIHTRNVHSQWLLQIRKRSHENFLTKMYGGMVELAAMPSFTRKEYYQESLSEMALTVEEDLDNTYQNGRSFLRDLKLVTAQIATKDWTPVDLKRVAMKVNILHKNLESAVREGQLSMSGANRVLVNFDTQEEIYDVPIELGDLLIEV